MTPEQGCVMKKSVAVSAAAGLTSGGKSGKGKFRRPDK
jgi:hypothetical protein